MELHPVHGGFAVAQTHNDAVVGGGGGFQDLVHGFGYDCQGVIAGRGEGVGHIFEYGDVLVHEAGGLAVHEFGSMGNGATECLRDGLVAKAYTQ